jgi:ubiquinone/menaquinone biosynthesis C-methylase UbiE
VAPSDDSDALEATPRVAPRVPEAGDVTAGISYVDAYDELQASLERHGWLGTEELLGSGIDAGSALELGPGPGYVGLEWLDRTRGTRLTGLDSNAGMVELARRRAIERGLAERTTYVHGSAEATAFEEGAFDAVFSMRSLHEWLDPVATFAETWRVLRPGGRVCVCDLRRDLPSKARNFMGRRMPSAQTRAGLMASIDAAYTAPEVQALLVTAGCRSCSVAVLPLGLRITGVKST